MRIERDLKEIYKHSSNISVCSLFDITALRNKRDIKEILTEDLLFGTGESQFGLRFYIPTIDEKHETLEGSQFGLYLILLRNK